MPYGKLIKRQVNGSNILKIKPLIKYSIMTTNLLKIFY